MLLLCFPSVVRDPGSPHSPKKLPVTEPAPKLTRPLLSSKGRCIFTLEMSLPYYTQSRSQGLEFVADKFIFNSVFIMGFSSDSWKTQQNRQQSAFCCKMRCLIYVNLNSVSGKKSQRSWFCVWRGENGHCLRFSVKLSMVVIFSSRKPPRPDRSQTQNSQQVFQFSLP